MVIFSNFEMIEVKIKIFNTHINYAILIIRDNIDYINLC